MAKNTVSNNEMHAPSFFAQFEATKPLPLRPCTYAAEKPDEHVSEPGYVIRAGNAVGLHFACNARGRRTEHRLHAGLSCLGWDKAPVSDSGALDFNQHVDARYRGTHDHAAQLPPNLAVLNSHAIRGTQLNWRAAPAEQRCEMWVDVKSLRSVRRGDPIQNELLWLEVHEDGWLRSGEADVLAYELWERDQGPPDGLPDDSVALFALLDRASLAEYVVGKLDWDKERVSFPEQAVWRIYRRQHRQRELMTLIPVEDALRAALCGYVRAFSRKSLAAG